MILIDRLARLQSVLAVYFGEKKSVSNEYVQSYKLDNQMLHFLPQTIDFAFPAVISPLLIEACTALVQQWKCKSLHNFIYIFELCGSVSATGLGTQKWVVSFILWPFSTSDWTIKLISALMSFSRTARRWGPSEYCWKVWVTIYHVSILVGVWQQKRNASYLLRCQMGQAIIVWLL